MIYFNDKRALKFLGDEGFSIVEGVCVKRISGVKRALKKVGLPSIARASSNKILYGGHLKGTVTDVKTYSEALSIFKGFVKIKGVNGVLFQKKIDGKEFFVGLVRDSDLGELLLFGDYKNKEDLVFRSCPVDKKEISKMIRETKIGKKVSKKVLLILQDNLKRLSDLYEKYPYIENLNISPLVVHKNKGKLKGATIIFN